MSINPKSTHEIIQMVNESLDSSEGMLDSKAAHVAREAFDALSQRELTALDRVELISLASRLSVLSQKEDSKTHAVVHSKEHLFGVKKEADELQNAKNAF